MFTILLFPLSVVTIVYVAICYFFSRTIIHLDRQPVQKTPKEYGMDCQIVEFNVVDGVDIKGWIIPAKSNKVIITTHVKGMKARVNRRV